MKRVAGKRAGRKHEVEAVVDAAALDLDARVEMIQALIPLGLEAVAEDLKQVVKALVGPRYGRGVEDRQYCRCT